MDERSESVALPPAKAQRGLQREVLAPQHTSSGLGAMLVATGAMFFAIASSAFVLRARSHDCDHHRTKVVRPAGLREPAPRPHPPGVAPRRHDHVHARAATTPVAPPSCGRALYEGNDDGTVSVVFGVCPDAPQGVAIDRIVTK